MINKKKFLTRLWKWGRFKMLSASTLQMAENERKKDDWNYEVSRQKLFQQLRKIGTCEKYVLILFN